MEGQYFCLSLCNAYQIVVILLCCILKHNLVEFKSLFVIYIVNIYSQTWNSKLYQ